MVDQNLCGHQNPRNNHCRRPIRQFSYSPLVRGLPIQRFCGCASSKPDYRGLVGNAVEFAVLINCGKYQVALHQERFAICDNGLRCRVDACVLGITENRRIPRKRLHTDLWVVLWTIALVDLKTISGAPTVGS